MQRACSALMGLLVLPCLVVGCDGSQSDPDGGADDVDGMVVDTPDAGPPLRTCGESSECDGDVCVRGFCIADCGADVAAFDGVLGEGLTPVANFCRPSAGRMAHRGEEGIEIWDVTSEADGTDVTFSLWRWGMNVGLSVPEAVEVSSETREMQSTSVTAFPGSYLSFNPAGSSVVYGYTTSEDGFPGGIFFTRTRDGVAQHLDAPGNFDAAWIDDFTILVNGFGLLSVQDGQGLYVTEVGGAMRTLQVATNFGAFSGSVETPGDIVLAGAVASAEAPWSDETTGGRVYLIPKERLQMAIELGEPINMQTDEQVSEVLAPDGSHLSSTFSLLGGSLLTTPFGGPLTMYRAVFDDSGSFSLTEAEELCSDATFTDAFEDGQGNLLLVHENGLLLVSRTQEG